MQRLNGALPFAIICDAGFSRHALNEWVKKVAIDTGQRGGLTTEHAAKMKVLERELRELRELKQANEILRKPSAYFPQAERNRPLKR